MVNLNEKFHPEAPENSLRLFFLASSDLCTFNTTLMSGVPLTGRENSEFFAYWHNNGWYAYYALA